TPGRSLSTVCQARFRTAGHPLLSRAAWNASAEEFPRRDGVRDTGHLPRWRSFDFPRRGQERRSSAGRRTAALFPGQVSNIRRRLTQHSWYQGVNSREYFIRNGSNLFGQFLRPDLAIALPAYEYHLVVQISSEIGHIKHGHIHG